MITIPRGTAAILAAAILWSGSTATRPGWAAGAPVPATAGRPSVDHRVVFQVDSDDPNVMKHAISGSINAARRYAEKNEPIAIEIVANGTGVNMFRADTSPVKSGLAALRLLMPGIVFSACGSTKQIMEAQEGHPLIFVEGVRVVPLGVERLIELEEAGWVYIHA